MLHLNSGWKQPATYQLADPVRSLLPRATPAEAPRDSTVINVAGQEMVVAAWVHAYHRRHGHPPALRTVLAAHCPQDPATPWSTDQLRAAAHQLQSAGWLNVDNAEEHPAQPGPRYWRRTSSPRRHKRHALSPRLEARQTPPVRRTVTPPAPERVSRPAQGPDLTLHTGPATALPASTASVVPKGIWLIPGAHAILLPDRN